MILRVVAEYNKNGLKVAISPEENFYNDVYSQTDSQGKYSFGGKKIAVWGPVGSNFKHGKDRCNFWLQGSGTRPGHMATVAKGMKANKLIIEPLNQYFNTGIEPLTPQEMFEVAGITDSMCN